MRKYSFVRRADWDAFKASVPPDVLAFQPYEFGRLPGVLLVMLNERTWELAKATGKFLPMPPPWANVARLSGPVKIILGTLAPDAITVGDAIEDLAGGNIFSE